MRSTLFRTFPTLFAGTLAAFALSAIVVPSGTGCSSSTAATKKPASRCTPGNYVFCRCQNREEGTKLCNDDGETFGKCEPCETPDNPEIPVDPGTGPTDGGPKTDTGPGPGPGTCGDKIVQDGEDCDDGNKANDDGCDDTCKLAGTDPITSRSCPGMDVHVWSKAVTWTSTTAGSTNTGSTSPNCTESAGAPTGTFPTTGAAASDRVLKVTAHKTGTMTVATSDVDYNSFLYVGDTCKGTDQPWLKCINLNNGVGGETMTFPVTAGKTYAVFVDGAGISGQQGVFRVTLSIQ